MRTPSYLATRVCLDLLLKNQVVELSCETITSHAFDNDDDDDDDGESNFGQRVLVKGRPKCHQFACNLAAKIEQI